MQDLKGTGRTTRMLEHAIKLAKSGRAVYVLMTEAQARHFTNSVPPELGIKFESHLPNLDWDTLKLRGAHPNCIVLIDHFYIERKYSQVLQMLHAYDPEDTTER